MRFLLACMNSMDRSAFVFQQNFWIDLVLWTVGAPTRSRAGRARMAAGCENSARR